MFGSPNRLGSSGFGQMPAFGGFGSTPTQTNPFGSATQPSQPAFGSSIFGSSTPFGASSQPTFGSTGDPSFGATSTPAFGATSTSAFDPQEAEAMCLLELMKRLKYAGLSNIFSESDCKTVVDGKGCVFTHVGGTPMDERAAMNISQEEIIIPPILEYKLPAEDVLARLSETEAVNLAKTIFASTTCTGDKLEIVVLNASGLHREYMDLRKKD